MTLFPDQKIEAIGTDLVFATHTQPSLEHIIWWAEKLKTILKEHPEYHDAYWEYNLDNETNEVIVYLCVYRPYTVEEKSLLETWKKSQEESDKKQFNFLKEKYGW